MSVPGKVPPSVGHVDGDRVWIREASSRSTAFSLSALKRKRAGVMSTLLAHFVSRIHEEVVDGHLVRRLPSRLLLVERSCR